MTPEQVRDELKRANEEASDKRSKEAVQMLMIIIMVPVVIVGLSALLS